MVTSVAIGALFSSSILGRDEGRAFLQILGDRFEPEKYNNYEPINRYFADDGIEKALDLWGSGFLWRRSKPRLQGSYWRGGRVNPHQVVYLTLSVRAFDTGAVIDLIERLDERFGLDFAYVHVETNKDFDDWASYRNRIKPFSEGVVTQDLQRGIPDVPWAMILGLPYRELFGDRLDTVPIHEKREFTSATYLQLTDDPRDIDRRRELVAEKRAAVKEHLNSAAFRGQEIDGRCRTPEFKFPPR